MSEAVPLRALLGLRVAEPPPPPDLDAIFAAGRAEGHAAAREEAEARIAALEAAHARALAAQEAAAAALIEATARELAHLGLAIARAALAAEPAARPDALAQRMAELLAAVPAEATATLRAHPEALAALAPLVPAGWALKGDPTLGATSVVADLADGAVRASLERRLSGVASELGVEP
jgi:flagellar biosynthesis/type III secretory pathway protein FliH